MLHLFSMVLLLEPSISDDCFSIQDFDLEVNIDLPLLLRVDCTHDEGVGDSGF